MPEVNFSKIFNGLSSQISNDGMKPFNGIIKVFIDAIYEELKLECLTIDSKIRFKKFSEKIDLKNSCLWQYTNLNIVELKNLLINQIEKKVRWRESIINMIKYGVDQFIEIGPGKVLSGLVKRIDKNVKITSINTQSDIESLRI